MVASFEINLINLDSLSWTVEIIFFFLSLGDLRLNKSRSLPSTIPNHHLALKNKINDIFMLCVEGLDSKCLLTS